MRGKRAKQLRKMAREIGHEMGLRQWLKYKLLGPYKRIVPVLGPTGIPLKDEKGNTIKQTITLYTRVNDGVRGIYQQLKRQARMATRRIDSDRRKDVPEAAHSYQEAA